MTRDELLAELLVERFGPIQHEWVAPADVSPMAIPELYVAHDFDEPLEPAFHDARPWTSRHAWADEYLDWRAA